MKKRIIQSFLLLLFCFPNVFSLEAAIPSQKSENVVPLDGMDHMKMAQADENPTPDSTIEPDTTPTLEPKSNITVTKKKVEKFEDKKKKKKFFLSDRRWIDDDKANDLLTPLERYSRRTKVNIFRRTEAIFFISIPFSMLTQFTLKSSFSLFNSIAALIEDGETPIDTPHFLYSHEKTIAESLDPFYVYTWSVNIFWPFVVAINDVIERTTTNAYTLRQKKNIRLLRFETDLMHTDF